MDKHLKVYYARRIVTPLKLLELFSDDVLVDIIFGYTTLYSHRERVGISFEITNEKIRLILSMLLGSINFQTVKCIGRRPRFFCAFFRIFIFVTKKDLINKTNFRSSFT